MEPKGHNENLENYFRKSLEEAGQSGLAEDWNTPSPEVWNQIHKEVKPGSLNRTVFYQRAAIMLLLLLLFLTFYQNHQQENKIGELSDRLETYEESLNTIKSELASTSKSTEARAAKEEEIPRIGKRGASIETLPKSEVRKVFASKILGGILSSVTNPTYQMEENLSTGSLSTKQIPTNTHYTSDGLNAHPTYLPQLTLHSAPQFLIEEEAEITRKQSVKGNRNYVRMLAGPLLASSDLIVLNPDRNRLNFSYIKGLQVGRNLNKNLSIELGIQYFQLNIEARSLRLLKFKQNQETLNPDGLYESSFSFELPGIESTESSELVLSRAQEESIPEDTSIPIEVLTENTKSYLQLPLVIQYAFDINKLRVGLRAGILNSFRLDNETDISALSLEIEDFSSLDVMHRRGPRGGKKDRVSYRPAMTAGLGIEYNFNDRLGLVIQPTYERDFDKTKVKRNKKIHSQSLSLSSGLIYKF
ncbi:MAG: hypothetical protein AAFY45_08985 [Bacteroidota bacterium]